MEDLCRQRMERVKGDKESLMNNSKQKGKDFTVTLWNYQ